MMVGLVFGAASAAQAVGNIVVDCYTQGTPTKFSWVGAANSTFTIQNTPSTAINCGVMSNGNYQMNSGTVTGSNSISANTTETYTIHNLTPTYVLLFNNVRSTAYYVYVNPTVTFDANGGSGSMNAQTAAGTANLTANTFTKAGYIFAGWNTLANGTGTDYADAASFNFAGFSGSVAPAVTLYAKWTVAPANDSVLTLTPGFAVGDLVAGAPFTVSGSDLEPNTAWDATIHSTPTQLGTGLTDSNGNFLYSSQLPSNIEPGQHRLVLTGTANDGSVWTRTVFLTVNASGIITFMSTEAAQSDLAHTGVPAVPLLVAAGALLAAGVLLRRRASHS